MLLRNIIALILIIIYVNKGLKDAMWDSLGPGSLKLIMIRHMVELILRASLYYSVKYFTLTTFAVFNNLAPILTLLLAFCILNEKVTRYDYVNIILGFGAVSLITYGMS